jgi:uncharacterized protein YndB with AHSA1/START domain
MTATTSSGTAKVTLPADDQILITREFNAPRHLVYKAWTTPELVRRWWHAKRGEVTVAEIDLRVGGRWRFVTAGEGYEVGFHGVYRLLVPGERIVCTEVYEGHPDAEASAALCTYTFHDAGGRTTVGAHTQLRTREDRDAMLDSGMEHGVQAAWELWDRVALALR